MRISLIVATDLDGTIGRDGRLPWHLPADLRHFKRITMGKPMIMGRKTWESIGRALPGRRSIVLTRRRAFGAPGALVAHTPEAALALAEQVLEAADETLVIGGAEIFHLFLPRATRLYWTQVLAQVPGDARFPGIDPAAWREVSREEHAADEKNAYAVRFLVLERAGGD